MNPPIVVDKACGVEPRPLFETAGASARLGNQNQRGDSIKRAFIARNGIGARQRPLPRRSPRRANSRRRSLRAVETIQTVKKTPRFLSLPNLVAIEIFDIACFVPAAEDHSLHGQNGRVERFRKIEKFRPKPMISRRHSANGLAVSKNQQRGI